MLEINKIYHGDCLELMKELPDKSINLILTDPPYGIKRGKQAMGKGGGLAKHIEYGEYSWDNEIPSKYIFNEMFRVSKNQIIFGGNYMIEHLFNSSCWIVWDKDNGNTDFSDCELIWTSFNTSVRKIKWRWSGMLQENMKNKDKRVHPTQKPIGVLEWILCKYSNENDLILDPFIGSGTTAVACIKTNRKYIGMEKVKNYCDITNRRIEYELSQLRLAL